MDLGEKLFQLLSKPFYKKKKLSSAAAYFEDFPLALSIIANAVTPHYVELKRVDEAQSHHLDTIYLPTAIDLFDQKVLNVDTYIYRTLFAAQVIKDKIFYQNTIETKRNVELLSLVEMIENKIILEFQYFKGLVESIRKPIYEKLKRFGLDHTSKKQNYELKSLYWVLWGGLLEPKARMQHKDENIPQKRKQGSDKKDAKVAHKIDTREPEKEKENLIEHSFEKLETVDQYQDGLKHTDGSDELKEHSNALDEIKLNALTKSSEDTTAVYNANLDFEIELPNESFVVEAKQELRLDEWDFKKADYRRNWCTLYPFLASEKILKTSTDTIRDELIDKYTGFIKVEKMKIESILNSLKWKKKLIDGDELDIDQYIHVQADTILSGHARQNYYMHKIKNHREFAVMILFDQSMSTDSWVQNRRVLDIELEAIGLFALLTKDSNDQMMVAGFNSVTRHKNEVIIYKQFHEPWEQFFQYSKVIEPSGYTRLGPAIRFAKENLKKTKARTKLLIILTDAKPTDYDGYEGRYGIEDVRQSIRECERELIFTHALAIDAEAQNRFHFMFGNNRYNLLKDPAQLPLQLLDIYKKSLKQK